MPKVKVKPRNRRLLLHKVGTETNKKEKREMLDTFYIPETLDVTKRGCEIYKVLDKAPDVTLDVNIGDFIVVEIGMVEKREISGLVTYYQIQENYVESVLESYVERLSSEI